MPDPTPADHERVEGCGHGCVICFDHRPGVPVHVIDGRMYHHDCAEDRSDDDTCLECVTPQDDMRARRVCCCAVCQAVLRKQTQQACTKAANIAAALVGERERAIKAVRWALGPTRQDQPTFAEEVVAAIRRGDA